MGQQIGATTYPKARKNYECMASDWIQNCLSEVIEDCDFSEKRELVKARRNKWKIVKGERYLRQTMIFEGEMTTFRAIPAMHDICVKCDIYQE